MFGNLGNERRIITLRYVFETLKFGENLKHLLRVSIAVIKHDEKQCGK